ncbi:ABC transporter substrate-binding protein [Amycolatopsis methanolica]|uniref:ABC transporter substrate-binding protein n=1 Tax=Amycolatopsis methanolica TaxID=1814 RepID=UPI00341BB60A
MALACGGGGGSSATNAAGDTAIKVGVISIVDVAPIYLGVSKGFFKEQHLDVSLETAQGGAAIVPGVMSGQFQFGFSNTISLLLAQSQGLPVKVVSSGNASTGELGKDFGAVVVKADSPIRTTADLAGKKVAVNTLKNINTTATINEVVRQAGGDPSKIQYVELAFPDIAAAVARGDVDAGQVVEPFL